jgi:uncharacterized protein involved in type VI secretion and phage assembly
MTMLSEIHGDDTESAPRRFYGKYRGIVTDNEDPQGRGRIRARVQGVLGLDEIGWALPAVPYAGEDRGAVFLPPPQSWVWIEFECGVPDDPIWTGCFWPEGEAPAGPTAPAKKVLKTDQATLIIDEQAGELSFEFAAGLRVVVDSSGVEITNGQGATISLSGATVSINSGALEVT